MSRRNSLSPRRSPSRSSPSRRRNSPPSPSLDGNGNRVIRRTQPTSTQLDELNIFRRVDFSNENLTEIPDWILDYTSQIEVLMLSGNQLTSLPPTIFQNLTQLRGLFLSFNRLTSLPPNLFQNLSELKWLDLDGNELTLVSPSLFRNNTKLKFIYLSGNNLSIRNQRELRDWAEQNDIEINLDEQDSAEPSPSSRSSPSSPSSPSSRSSPSRRSSPNRTQRRTQPTQEQIDRIRDDGEVDLTDADLTEVPDWILDYSSEITFLDLSGNQLTSFPSNFFQNFNMLQEMGLSDNQLTSLPPNLFQNLRQLERLLLSRNQLSFLPPTIFQNLTQLKHLSLYGNQLTSLPPNLFQNLTELETLSLSENQLTYLPLNLFQNLTKLKGLYLHTNHLSARNQEELREWAERNNIQINLSSQIPTTSPSPSSTRSRTQRHSPSPARRRSPSSTSPSQRERSSPSQRGRTSPSHSPQEQEQPFDVTCLNDEDIFGIDDFTKGVKEFEAHNRVIILVEGRGSKQGDCMSYPTLVKSMLTTQDGVPTTGPWSAMNQRGSNATNRYFKLPNNNLWVDFDGFKNILDGWKVLRLKYLRTERIGSFFGVGNLHGHEEKIYTLVRVNSKYQGKNAKLNYYTKREDGNLKILFEANDDFINVF